MPAAHANPPYSPRLADEPDRPTLRARLRRPPGCPATACGADQHHAGASAPGRVVKVLARGTTRDRGLRHGERRRRRAAGAEHHVPIRFLRREGGGRRRQVGRSGATSRPSRRRRGACQTVIARSDPRSRSRRSPPVDLPRIFARCPRRGRAAPEDRAGPPRPRDARSPRPSDRHLARARTLLRDAILSVPAPSSATVPVPTSPTTAERLRETSRRGRAHERLLPRSVPPHAPRGAVEASAASAARTPGERRPPGLRKRRPAHAHDFHEAVIRSAARYLHPGAQARRKDPQSAPASARC